MERIIGYQTAKNLMQQGHYALEVSTFRGANRVYMQSPDGVRGNRIRADSWDKLRRDCHLKEKQGHGKRGQLINYLWAYGDIVGWHCTYQHPTTGEAKRTIEHAVTKEEAEAKALKNACGWTLVSVEKV